jgi:hypothetical protein
MYRFYPVLPLYHPIGIRKTKTYSSSATLRWSLIIVLNSMTITHLTSSALPKLHASAQVVPPTSLQERASGQKAAYICPVLRDMNAGDFISNLNSTMGFLSPKQNAVISAYVKHVPV